MYLRLTILIYVFLIISTAASSKSKMVTIGLHKSHELHNLAQLKTLSTAIQMGSSTNVSLTDNLDMYYYGSIWVGYRVPSLVKVVFDTGSSDLWVASSSIWHKIENYSHHHNVYNHWASSTSETSKTPFTIPYQKGFASGVIGKDYVNVGSLMISGQVFGEALDMDEDTASKDFGGIFGLAYPTNAVIDANTPIVNMIRQGLLDEPVFAFSLNQFSYSSSENYGVITIGGLDPSHYAGDITYTPVIEQAYWKMEVEGLYIDSRRIAASFAAVPDSGSSLMTGPEEYIDIINDAIGGTRYGDLNVIDCSTIHTLPNVTYVIAGRPFVLQPYAYTMQVIDNGSLLCFTLFAASDLQFFVLGDVFMRQFYTVFDMGLNRVGFAVNRNDEVVPYFPSSSISDGLPTCSNLLALLISLLQICFYIKQL